MIANGRYVNQNSDDFFFADSLMKLMLHSSAQHATEPINVRHENTRAASSTKTEVRRQRDDDRRQTR